MSEFREWFIETHELVKNKIDRHGNRMWPQVYETNLAQTVHVIEKLAYDNLAAENAALKNRIHELESNWQAEELQIAKEKAALQRSRLFPDHVIVELKSQNAALVEALDYAIKKTSGDTKLALIETKSKLDALGMGEA